MVYQLCPKCGAGMHGLINDSDVVAWYAKHHPGVSPGETIQSVCPACQRIELPDSAELISDVGVCRSKNAPPRREEGFF